MMIEVELHEGIPTEGGQNLIQVTEGGAHLWMGSIATGMPANSACMVRLVEGGCIRQIPFICYCAANRIDPRIVYA